MDPTLQNLDERLRFIDQFGADYRLESVIQDEEVKRKVYEENARRVLRLEEAALVD